MTTRRDVLIQTVAAGTLAVTGTSFAQSADDQVALKPPGKLVRRPRIKSVIRREETLLRLGGIGDCFQMSWAADDRQLVLVNDGAGWDRNPKSMFNHRMFSISGAPSDAQFREIEGYPMLPHAGLPGRPRYYGWGTLALDGRIYQFLALSNSDATSFKNVKLIYSPDNGLTWCNQDGSSPVVWEDFEHINRDTMLFIDEPQQTFSMLSVLQMGQNYRANRDGYVYIYAPNGTTDGTMNELVMLRVPKRQILNRGAYEYFVGIGGRRNAIWNRDINMRNSVHTFPRGWLGDIPRDWSPSITFNESLGLYMMANSAWKYNNPGDHPPAQPSYLGFWTAPDPWGPWNQIHEETAWTPGADGGARAYDPQIAPKWIAADGKSFWLVWSDYQGAGSMDPREFESLREKEGDFAATLAWHRTMKFYAFNTQGVDLVLA